MRIVVGVDGSQGSHKALQWALDEARAHHAEVLAVHAWSFVLPLSGIRGAADVPIVVFEETAAHVLATAIAEVDATGVKLESSIVNDGPAQALLDAAKGADLLVVGSRGRGGFGGLLLGSVSQQVSHHAPCPVVIVPQ